MTVPRVNDYIGTYGMVHRTVDEEFSLSMRTVCGRDLVDGRSLSEVPKNATVCKRCFGLPVRKSRKQQYREHLARKAERDASKGLTPPPSAPTL